MLTTKIYRCKNCGHLQQIETNHTGECFDYCGRKGRTADPNESDDLKAGCSWKPSFGKDVAIPMFGNQAYRRFEYVGPLVEVETAK